MPVFVAMSGRYVRDRSSSSSERRYLPAGSRHPIQPRHGLDVVIEDVGPGVEHGPQRRLDSLEVWNQHLDAAAGHARPRLPDRLGEDRRAAVGQIVAIDRGDDGVLQAHARRPLRRRAPAPPVSSSVGRPWATAQYAHARVQTSPRIMNVAVPWCQHSPMFGQRASSQTVLSFRSCMMPLRRR